MIAVTSLVVLMFVAAILAAAFKDLLNAVIASSVVSLITAILFYLLQAPDVAMAEASIGTALVIVIFIIAIKKTRRYED
ncbi:MAG: hypothetical protein DRP84_08620 [Spirochaetes bacterium]|nr:MAG: hypothetical protein DRP84_08620 [Spirochaetota bacterium]